MSAEIPYSNWRGFCKSCSNNFEFVIEEVEAPNINNIKLVNLESKHIAWRTDQNSEIYDKDMANGYINIQWGAVSFPRKKSLNDRRKHIEKMIESKHSRPIRIVITENYIWTDNIHSTLSWIKRLGESATIADIPHYIVDTRNYPKFKMSSVKNSLSKNQEDRYNACIDSLRLHIISQYRTGSLTLADLYNQLYD